MKTPIVAALLFLTANASTALATRPQVDIQDTGPGGQSVLNNWPQLPPNFSVPDYRSMTLSTDALLFDAVGQPPYQPSYLFWVPGSQLNKSPFPNLTGLGIRSYVDQIVAPVVVFESDQIATMALTVSGSLAGVDFTRKNVDGSTVNIVNLEKRFFMSRAQAFANNPNAAQLNGDRMYDFLPNIFAFQILDLYGDRADQAGDTASFASLCRNSANTFVAANQFLGGNYNVRGFYNGGSNVLRINDAFAGQEGSNEPDGAAGFAILGVMANQRFGGQQYLDMADQGIQYLENFHGVPNYEILLPYGVLASARMNAEFGRSYDVSKLMNELFSASTVRGASAPASSPQWGIVTGSWGGYPVYGLASTKATDPANEYGGYAFYFDTILEASTLAPVVRYQKQFANAIGKYLLHVASNSKIFFSNMTSPLLQDPTTRQWELNHAPAFGANIPYEGVRRLNDQQNISPYLKGDAVQGGWAYTDLSIYSAGVTGMFGSLLHKTNDPYILAVSLTKTDFNAPKHFPTYLYYNPHPATAQVTVDLSMIRAENGLPASKGIALYDTISQSWIKSVSTAGSESVNVPAASSLVLVAVPDGVASSILNGQVVAADGTVIDYQFR